jgi:hypothetical protein
MTDDYPPVAAEPAADFPSSDILGHICVAAGAAILFATIAALAASHGSDWLALAAAALFLVTPKPWRHQ